jgi:hypothetical protein
LPPLRPPPASPYSFIVRLDEPLIRIIPPGGSVEFLTPLKLRAGDGRTFFPIGPPDDKLPLDAPPGLQRFRVVYRSDNASIRRWDDLQIYFNSPQPTFTALPGPSSTSPNTPSAGSSQTASDPRAKFSAEKIEIFFEPVEKKKPVPRDCWEGTIRSNDVVIRILQGDRP